MADTVELDTLNHDLLDFLDLTCVFWTSLTITRTKQATNNNQPEPKPGPITGNKNEETTGTETTGAEQQWTMIAYDVMCNGVMLLRYDDM
jgi:hypothetical protein